MALSYADHINILAAAHELKGKYGNSASARTWRCARVLKAFGDDRSAMICAQLAMVIDSMSSDYN
jgi:hypothetical protein